MEHIHNTLMPEYVRLVGGDLCEGSVAQFSIPNTPDTQNRHRSVVYRDWIHDFMPKSVIDGILSATHFTFYTFYDIAYNNAISVMTYTRGRWATAPLNPKAPTPIFRKVLKCMCVLAARRCVGQRIQIRYAPLDLPRMCKSPPFSHESFNGGMFIHTEYGKEIMVFRREDSDKVILHELFHLLNESHERTPSDDDLDYHIKTSTQIQSRRRICVCEAYNDAFATIISIVIDSMMAGADSFKTHQMFRTEVLYTYQLTKYLLKLAGFKNINELFDRTNRPTPNQWIQHADVFSYIVLKCGALLNVGRLVRDFDFRTFVWNKHTVWSWYDFATQMLKKDSGAGAAHPNDFLDLLSPPSVRMMYVSYD